MNSGRFVLPGVGATVNAWPVAFVAVLSAAVVASATQLPVVTTRTTPIGRDALVADLASEFIAYGPEDLLAIPSASSRGVSGDAQAAREMGLAEDWKAAVEKVKKLHVGARKQPDLIRDLAREAEAYVEKHDLVTVPPLANENLAHAMMSPERQKVTPFFTGGETISVS